MTRDIFDKGRLHPELDAFVRDSNPWWEGKPGPALPPYRRWAFHTTLKKMNAGLAHAVVLRGPRQVGKTTLQLQIIEQLMASQGIEPTRIFRVQFDELPSLRGLKDSILSLARWYENRILKHSLNETARAGKPAYIFLDEVQNLNDWAPQIKALVDQNTVKVLVTGSSALRIEAGRDSLAGRITTVELGTLLLREIAEIGLQESLQPFLPENGLEPLLRQEFWKDLHAHGVAHKDLRDRAFKAFSLRGGYPMAQANPEVPWSEIADQLNETVVKRAIQHDLRMGARGKRRDQQLLEEVYRLACRYAGQSPGRDIFVQEVKQLLEGGVGWTRILAYLRFLDGALLIKLIHPMELRLKRRKGNDKICLCDHALRASWLQEIIPLHDEGLKEATHLSDLAGHIAESAVGYYLSSLPHLDLAHFPTRAVEPEIDFVLTVGDKRIPLEVKYRRRIDPHSDTLGIRSFIEKSVYNAPFGILVTLLDDVPIPDPRIVSISLPSLLLMR